MDSMTRQGFFLTLAGMATAFFFRLFPSMAPLGVKQDITATIIRQHRQTIIDAFSSDTDSYMSNMMDIQDNPIYDTFQPRALWKPNSR